MHTEKLQSNEFPHLEAAAEATQFIRVDKSATADMKGKIGSDVVRGKIMRGGAMNIDRVFAPDAKGHVKAQLSTLIRKL